MTDSRIEPIDSIADRLRSIVSGLSTMKFVSDELPFELKFDACVIRFIGADQVTASTGGYTDNSWAFMLTFYFSVTTEPKLAERAFRRTFVELFDALRADPTLSGACEEVEVEDQLGEPPIDLARGAVVKQLIIRAKTEEG